MARRYLAVAEAKLGVQFPDSYVDALRTQQALTKFPLGELYAPNECEWMEDFSAAGQQPARTMLVIGMYQRGQAAPLVLLRASTDVPELEPTLYYSLGGESVRVADSLLAAMKKPAPTG